MDQPSSGIRGGLALHEIKLTDYDPEWPKRFADESRRFKFIPHVLKVEHIGSTALPGMRSKPVVDIAAMVECRPDHPEVVHALCALGYQCHGEYGLPGRIFFTCGNPPCVHLHVVAQGSPLWSDWLTFRDYLTHHPDMRNQYEQEKLRIMAACNGDRHTYTAMKRPFIQHVLALARNTTEQYEE